jgi:hypothetical protein
MTKQGDSQECKADLKMSNQYNSHSEEKPHGHLNSCRSSTWQNATFIPDEKIFSKLIKRIYGKPETNTIVVKHWYSLEIDHSTDAYSHHICPLAH